MGRLKELIKSFINPIPPEKSLDELAAEAGIGEAELKLLRNSRDGVNWKFADEVEETKKMKNTNVATHKETHIQPESKNVAKEQKADYERD